MGGLSASSKGCAGNVEVSYCAMNAGRGARVEVPAKKMNKAGTAQVQLPSSQQGMDPGADEGWSAAAASWPWQGALSISAK